jgi:hypothetical protein
MEDVEGSAYKVMDILVRSLAFRGAVSRQPALYAVTETLYLQEISLTRNIVSFLSLLANSNTFR